MVQILLMWITDLEEEYPLKIKKGINMMDLLLKNEIPLSFRSPKSTKPPKKRFLYDHIALWSNSISALQKIIFLFA